MTDVEVGLCTFRRDSLFDTLRSVAAQNLPDGLSTEVIVADNDATAQRRAGIEAFGNEIGLKLRYVHAPASNISIARNAILDHARGDVLLLIDDDEVADPQWIGRLVGHWKTQDATVVFGPSLAVYPPSTPGWIRSNDFHSTVPVRNRGIVETGISGNVLLDLSSPEIRETRFDINYGRTGGEDTDFFFRLHRKGVRMEIAEDAIVREIVTPARMKLRWLLRRKLNSGAIYGTCSPDGKLGKRIALFSSSMAKASYCGLRTFLSAPTPHRSAFWLARGSFHFGVMAGCVSPPSREVYGRTP